MAEYLESLNDPFTVHRVVANWLLDLDQYNEWMNENDYEVDATGWFYSHLLLSMFLHIFIIRNMLTNHMIGRNNIYEC